jgi:hypothetical protein
MSPLHLLPTADLAKIFHHFSKTPNTPKKIHRCQLLLLPILVVLPTNIQGYISPKCADYLIWELGVFEEGSKVVLGDNLVLARIHLSFCYPSCFVLLFVLSHHSFI